MADKLWFWEQQTLGKWWPRTAPDQPAPRSTEGRKPVRRGIIEVDARHHHLSLKALHEIYSRDGRFVATQGPEHLKKVMELP